MYNVLLVIHTIIVIFMIVMVLLQRSDQDGMGLSGGGGNQFLSGRSQANLLTRTTAILAGLFILSSLTLAVMGGHMGKSSILDNAPAANEAAPAEKPAAEKPKATEPSVPKAE